MSGAPFNILDLVDLGLLTMAIRGRQKLAEDTQEFYEEFFTDLDESVMTSCKDLRKDTRLSGLREAVGRHAPHGRVLDVGCGVGDTLATLSTLPDTELHGIEYSAATLTRAKRLLGARAELRQGSATALPYDDAYFDCITCSEVLEHLPDDRAALAECHRVLRPGGKLVVTVPYRHWFPAYKSLIGHFRHYDREGLEHFLSASQFAIIDWIANYPRWHRAADYSYAVCRVASMAANRLGAPTLPHELRLPGARRPLLEQLSDMLEPLRARDAVLDYRIRSTSTWVVAERGD